jgi:hypothetical protein
MAGGRLSQRPAWQNAKNRQNSRKAMTVPRDRDGNVS